MNNGLWDDRLNHLKQHDLHKEIEHLHLLREAGLDGHSHRWLDGLGRALQGGLLLLGKRWKERRAAERAMYKPVKRGTSV
jgi:hypothetical protein